MSGPAISMTVEGLSVSLNEFTALKNGVRNRILRKAFARGITPCKQAIRRNTPRDTGTARKNVVSKVTNKVGRTPVALAGFRKLKGQRKNPAKYAHLLEGATKPHAIRPRTGKALKIWNTLGKRQAKAIGLDGAASVATFRRSVAHPGTRATHLIARSYRASRRAAESAIVHSMRDSLSRRVR